MLGAVTFVVFGAVLLGPALDELTVSIVLYALLSLTVIRMAPVALALVGTGMRPQTIRFLGWFGPRGLASIVFALMLEEDGGVPHAETIMVTAFVTVGLSVLLHGLTAAPLAERYARWFESHPKGGAPVVERESGNGRPLAACTPGSWHSGRVWLKPDTELRPAPRLLVYGFSQTPRCALRHGSWCLASARHLVLPPQASPLSPSIASSPFERLAFISPAFTLASA